MKTRYTVWLLAIAMLTTTGCARKALAPEQVPVDRAECARCRMLISNERGSAQRVSASDDTRFYDDVGCLAADWAGRSAEASRSGEVRAFVRVDSEWLDAQAASFARPADAHTAMGSGFVAFRTREAAARADRSGRALTFDDVVRNTAGE